MMRGLIAVVVVFGKTWSWFAYACLTRRLCCVASLVVRYQARKRPSRCLGEADSCRRHPSGLESDSFRPGILMLMGASCWCPLAS